MNRITLISILSLTVLGCSGTQPVTTQKIAQKGLIDAKITPDNHYSIYVSTNYGVGVWDNANKRLAYHWQHDKTKPAKIVAVSISGNSHYVLTAEKRNIVLWDLTTGKAIQYLALPSDIRAIALSQQGSRALIGLLNAKALYLDLTTGQTLQSLQHLETINSVALSPDGKYALTGSDDKLAVLWDLTQAKPIHQWQHQKRVRYVAFSPKAHYAMTCASQDSVNIWNIPTGHLQSNIVHKRITTTAATFSQDESRYALGVLPNQVRLYETKHSTLLQQWQIEKHQKWKPTSTFVYGLSFDEQSVLSLDSYGMLSQWRITE